MGNDQTFETVLNSSTLHDARFAYLLAEVHKKKVAGTKRYGETGYNSLGTKGIFVDINRKYQRLKHWFWDQTPSKDLGEREEAIEDTLLDLAAYSLLMLMEYRQTVSASKRTGFHTTSKQKEQSLQPKDTPGSFTIAIDFDATIATYSCWKGKSVFGEPLPRVKQALEKFKSKGATIIINTTRSEVEDIKEYLDRYALPFDFINFNPEGETLNLSSSKVLADVYIDDRAVPFEGEWADDYVDRVLSFAPYWKRQKEERKENG